MSETDETVELDAHVDLLRRYTEAKNASDAWKKIADGLREELEKIIGDKEVATVNGQEVVTFKPTSTFRKGDFQKDEPELYRFYEVEKTVKDLDLAMLKTTRPELYEQYRSRRFVSQFQIP